MHQHCLTPDNLRACSGCSEAQLQIPRRKTLSGLTVMCLPWVQSPVAQSSRRLEVSPSPPVARRCGVSLMPALMGSEETQEEPLASGMHTLHPPEAPGLDRDGVQAFKSGIWQKGQVLPMAWRRDAGHSQTKLAQCQPDNSSAGSSAPWSKTLKKCLIKGIRPLNQAHSSEGLSHANRVYLLTGGKRCHDMCLSRETSNTA